VVVEGNVDYIFVVGRSDDFIDVGRVRYVGELIILGPVLTTVRGDVQEAIVRAG
jgi:hypothetical protein